MTKIIERADKLRLSNKFQEALDLLLPISVDNHDLEILRLIARSYEGLFQWEKALETWRVLQKFSPGNQQALRAVPVCLESLGLVDQAYFEYEKGFKIHPTDPVLFLGRLLLEPEIVNDPQKVLAQLAEIKSSQQFQSNDLSVIIDRVRDKLIGLHDPDEIMSADHKNVLEIHPNMDSGISADLIELYNNIEPIGATCETGFVQRARGVENLSLFRWASIRGKYFINLLDENFKDYDSIENYRLGVSSISKEYFLEDVKYQTGSHTWVHQNQISKEQLLPRLMKRQEFLIRKLQESMSEGKKLFVHTIDYDYSFADLTAIHLRLKKFGVTKLLFLARNDEMNKVGSFTEIAEGCLISYLQSMQPQPTVVGDWDNILIKTFKRLSDTI